LNTAPGEALAWGGRRTGKYWWAREIERKKEKERSASHENSTFSQQGRKGRIEELPDPRKMREADLEGK